MSEWLSTCGRVCTMGENKCPACGERSPSDHISQAYAEWEKKQNWLKNHPKKLTPQGVDVCQNGNASVEKSIV